MISKKGLLIAVVVIVALTTILGTGGFGLGSGISQTPQDAQDAEPVVEAQELAVGTGPQAAAGDTLTVNYTGTLVDGTKFDSSYDRNEPISLVLGAGDVIRGWDIGLTGMRAGGKRKLTIPPELAYGDQAVDGIPANATLVFEVELLSIAPKAQKTP